MKDQTPDEVANALLSLKGDDPIAHVAAFRVLDPLLERVARRYLCGREESLDIEDVLQDCRIRLLEGVRDYYTYDSTRAAASWVRTIARWAAHESRRKATGQRRANVTSLDRDQYQGHNGHGGGESYTLADLLTDHHEKNPANDAAIHLDVLDAIEIARRHLSPYERAVLRRFVCGQSYKQIAEELGTDYKSIDNSRARVRRSISEFQAWREATRNGRREREGAAKENAHGSLN